MLTIHTLAALKDNFIYALTAKDRRCAVIDPGDAKPVMDFLSENGFTLSHILLTHHHWDHINGAPELIQHTGCKVLASRYDAERLPFKTEALKEGTDFDLLGEPFRVFEVPGHTLGQVAFYFYRLKALFPGDTLFSAGCGRLFEGTAEMMFQSLSKLKTLPLDTKIYFGHEYTLRNLEFVEFNCAADLTAVKHYKEKCQERLAALRPTTPTTLATELEVNPFLRATTANEFAHWRGLRDHW